MKTKLLLQIILPSMLSLNVHAQSSLAVREPDFAGTAVWVNGNEGVPLESQIPTTKAKTGASIYLMGVGSVKTYISVDEKNSNVRIPASNNDLQFIVRVSDNSIDPSSVINLSQFDSKPTKRELNNGKATTYGTASSGVEHFLQFTAVKYGEHSYLITFKGGLPIGEYGIFINEDAIKTIKLFGVGTPEQIGAQKEELIGISKSFYIGTWKAVNNAMLEITQSNDILNVRFTDANNSETNWTPHFDNGFLWNNPDASDRISYTRKTLLFKGMVYSKEE